MDGRVAAAVRVMVSTLSGLGFWPGGTPTHSALCVHVLTGPHGLQSNKVGLHCNVTGSKMEAYLSHYIGRKNFWLHGVGEGAGACCWS